MATCQYNGVTFTSLYSSRVTARPIYDDAKRTVVYVEHTLEVNGFISSSTSDTTLSTMRRSLTTPAGNLDYEDKGYGDLVINTNTSGVWDAAWGPMPEVLEWAPLGGDGLAAKVKWRVVVRIPECTTARYRNAVAAHNHEADYEIDQDGYTTVRHKGYLEIPMTRLSVNDRSMPDLVDLYREQVDRKSPTGFRRENRSYHISKDKRRLDYTFTDKQLPVPLPKLCTAIDARQSFDSRLAKPFGFAVWIFRLDATITLAAGVSKEEALTIFTALLGSRLRELRRKKKTVIPQTYSVEEDIFGRTSRFTATFHCISQQPLKIGQWLGLSGLWSPIEGTSYQQWRTSLQSYGAEGTRGFANLQYGRADDVIVDLCQPAQAQQVLSAAKPPNAHLPAGGGGPRVEVKGDEEIKVDGLTPGNAWMDYNAGVRWRESQNKARHKRLPLPLGSENAGPLTFSATAQPDYRPRPAQDTTSNHAATPRLPHLAPDVFQRTSSPTRTLSLEGYGIRVGWRVPAPSVVSVGGQPVEELDRDVVERVIGHIGLLPVFLTTWTIDYGVPDTPASIPWVGGPIGPAGGEGVSAGTTSAGPVGFLGAV